MFKTDIKRVLTTVGAILLVVATAIIALIEIVRTGTVSGATLIPALIGLVWFGIKSVVGDLKSYKELYEAADDE